jgi:hypothetical protein
VAAILGLIPSGGFFIKELIALDGECIFDGRKCIFSIFVMD